jgi:calcineurin-like phosphoesterase family protein
MIWFTSDTHWNHTNILKYCSRPFANVKQMNDELIRRWNSVVKQDDTVYHLGDVAFGSTQQTVDILNQLAGNKVLIVGNHDSHNLQNREFRACFTRIEHYYELQHNNHLYTMSHYPMLSWQGSNRSSVSLAGHRHLRKQEGNILRFDVGVDANDFTPVSIEYLEQWRRETKAAIKAAHNTPSDRRGTMRNEGLESYNNRRTVEQVIASLPVKRQAKIKARYWSLRVFFGIKDVLIRLFN